MAFNVSSFFAQSNTKQNRRIFIGPKATFNWIVPEGTTEVEVNVWGGGGAGGLSVPFATNPALAGGGGGGGGGFARHLYKVTGGDILRITVAGSSGSSSVSCPSNPSPQPISALGGSSGTATSGGAGGTGSIASVPIPLRTSITASFSGGAGGSGGPGTHAGSGGGAGFIFTNGEPGLAGSPIAVPEQRRGGFSCPLEYTGYESNGNGYSFVPKKSFFGLTNVFNEGQVINQNKSKWFYLEEFLTNLIDVRTTVPGSYITDIAYQNVTNTIYPTRNRFLGGGASLGRGFEPQVNDFRNNKYPALFWATSSSVGGGGAGSGYWAPSPTPTVASPSYQINTTRGEGGVGAVIIYW